MPVKELDGEERAAIAATQHVGANAPIADGHAAELGLGAARRRVEDFARKHRNIPDRTTQPLTETRTDTSTHCSTH